jgi:hypothetical protein
MSDMLFPLKYSKQCKGKNSRIARKQVMYTLEKNGSRLAVRLMEGQGRVGRCMTGVNKWQQWQGTLFDQCWPRKMSKTVAFWGSSQEEVTRG